MSRDGARAGAGRAVVLVLLAALGLLVSTAGTWVTGAVERPAPLPAETVSYDAASLAPAVRALGLVVLAAAPALLATRGRGRVAVGVVLVLAGVGAGLAAAGPAFDPAGAAGPGAGGVSATFRPFLALAAAALTVAAGGLVVLRGRSWAAMGRRYESPAARAGTAAAVPPAGDGAVDPGTGVAADVGEDAPSVDAARAWEALDRGEDPTGT